MTQHYREHADQIVADFKELLGAKAANAVGEESFAELAMLIESGLTTSVVDAMEKAADQVGAMATEIRKHAERYDDE